MATSFPKDAALGSRFREAFKVMKDLAIVHTQKDLADLIKSNEGNISNLFKGDLRYTTESRAKSFVEATGIPFNVDYILTGKGELLPALDGTKSNRNADARPIGRWMPHNVRRNAYHSARAGAPGGFGDPDFPEDLQTQLVVTNGDLRGEYAVYDIEGDSMDNGSPESFVNGCSVLCRLYPESEWQYGIKRKNATYCVIVTKDDGAVMKQVVNHDRNRGTLTLHSLNPAYEDFDVSLADVQAIFYVEQSIMHRG